MSLKVFNSRPFNLKFVPLRYSFLISFNNPAMTTLTNSKSTDSKRITRLAARRSSIVVQELPLPSHRKTLCRTILDDSDNDNVAIADKSYRNLPADLSAKHASKQTQINSLKVSKMMPVQLEEEENNTKISTIKVLTSPKKKKAMEEQQIDVTPPKQKKIHNNENLLSPSSLFNQLHLNSPQKLESAEETNQGSNRNLFQTARKALHSTAPIEMPGREKEHSELRTFIKDHLSHKTAGSLYVSGPPGTGKTASLSKILKEPEIEDHFKEVYINCTSIKSSTSIYSRIVRDLAIKTSSRNEKDFIVDIHKYLLRCHKMVLLVLDEIDQLESKNQSVLYTIFEWPAIPKAKLVLVGIANALDLTDRILPRLHAQCELKPLLMHFAPYSKAQIIEIFTNRLETAHVLHLFHPVALQMLAGKVAAISGDVRRALDIGRRVVEIVEQHQKQAALKSIENHEQSANIERTVDLKHVLGVLNTVYGTANHLDGVVGAEAFPLQQKIIVCSLLLIVSKARNKDVTIGKLHDVYRKICAKRNLLAIDQAEFVGLCSLIETKGIIRVSGRKEPRLNKVSMEWDVEEVAAALKDKQLMSTILQDVSVLGKL